MTGVAACCGGLMVVGAPFKHKSTLNACDGRLPDGHLRISARVEFHADRGIRSGQESVQERTQDVAVYVDKPRTVFIVAASVGLGLGAEMHAYGVNSVGGVKHTMGYKLLKDTDDIFFQTLAIIFESGIAAATIMALVLSFIWPDSDAALTKREFLKFDKDGLARSMLRSSKSLCAPLACISATLSSLP